MRAPNFIPFDEFERRWVWNQGQHLCIIGPNGSGKTYLWKRLLQYREMRHGMACVLGTKPEDVELESLITKRHYIRMANNTNWTASSYPRILLWPPGGNLRPSREQRTVFVKALEGMWRKGRWVAVMDEMRYLTDHLKMRTELDTLFLQARSSKMSLVGVTQRPAWVPLEAFSQSAHLFFFRCRDDVDLKRLQGLGAADPKEVKYVVQNLNQFEFAYVDALKGEVLITKVGTRRRSNAA